MFYRDWHPTRLGKFASRALAWMSGKGLTPPILVTLQVRGRRSGRLHNTVLVVTEHQGQRYLVSMLGDGSDWVRNIRAAGGKASNAGSHFPCSSPKSQRTNEPRS